MITIGLVFLLLGFLLGVYILWVLGIIALVIGLVFLAAGTAGHAIGGRRHWY